MTISLDGEWTTTPEASVVLIRVLIREDRLPIIIAPDGSYPDSVLVAWSIVVDTLGVETFTAAEFEDYFDPESTVDNVDAKYKKAVKSVEDTGEEITYDTLAQAFLDTYLYNSMFTILVDEFASKDRALEFAQSQLGSAPTPSGAEGEDPRSQWLS